MGRAAGADGARLPAAARGALGQPWGWQDGVHPCVVSWCCCGCASIPTPQGSSAGDSCLPTTQQLWLLCRYECPGCLKTRSKQQGTKRKKDFFHLPNKGSELSPFSLQQSSVNSPQRHHCRGGGGSNVRSVSSPIAPTSPTAEGGRGGSDLPPQNRLPAAPRCL